MKTDKTYREFIKVYLDCIESSKEKIEKEKINLDLYSNKIRTIVNDKINKTSKIWADVLKDEKVFYESIPEEYKKFVEKDSISRFESFDFCYHTNWISFLFTFKGNKVKIKIPTIINKIDTEEFNSLDQIEELHKILVDIFIATEEKHSPSFEVGRFDNIKDIFDALNKTIKKDGEEEIE